MFFGFVSQTDHFWNVKRQRNCILILKSVYFSFVNVDEVLKALAVLLMDSVKARKFGSRFADLEFKNKAPQWSGIQKYWLALLEACVGMDIHCF